MEVRTWKVAGVVSVAVLSGIGGDQSAAGLMPTSSNAFIYKNVWGIMKNTAAVGVVSMSGGGGINLADIANGVPFPCFPSYVSASAGAVYLLA